MMIRLLPLLLNLFPIFVSLFIFSSVGLAQEQEIIIKLIEIRGSKRIDAEGLLAKLALKEGDIFSPQRVQEDVKTLYQTGFFDQVNAEVYGLEGGLAIVFVVRERQMLVEVAFEGHVQMTQERLKEKVPVKVGVFLNPDGVKTYVDKIKKTYEGEGYYNIEVTPVIESLSGDQAEDQAKLTFLIKEGEQAYIRKINIIGNKAITEKKIKKQIESSEYFFLTSWFTESGRYKKEVIDADVDRLRDLYLNQGYLGVRIDPPKVDMSNDRRWFEVMFSIQEGEQSMVGEVRYEGNTVVDTLSLIGVTQTGKGEVFNKGQVREDILNMTNLYGERGYLFANVIPQISPHPGEKEVDILFQVSEQESVKVRQIHITGNDKTRDKVIRREIRLNEGEQVDTKLLRRSFQRINNLNFFENIEIVPHRIDKGWVDLDVRVKEKSTGSISIGGGYSSVDRFIATIDVTQGNLFGRGQVLKVKIDTGKLRKTYSLTFREPYLLDTETSGTFDLFNQRRIFPSYQEGRIGGDISIGKSYGEYVTANVSYNHSTLDISNIETNAPDIIRAQVGKSQTRSIGFSLARDTRDFIFDPQTGVRNSASVEYAGSFLGGDNDYYKIVLDSARFFPLWRDHVFSLHGRIGYADGVGGKALPVGERFFVGGIQTIRGFDFGKAGPVTPGGQAFGGNKEIILNVEYLIPLVTEAKIKWLFFYDDGRAFDDTERLNLSSLRQSAGFGLRWITPVGPIRLEWARNLRPKPGEKSRLVEFSIGTLF